MQYPLVPPYGGTATMLNITAPTVIKPTAGRVWKVIVNTVNTAAGGIYDANTLAGDVAGNLIQEIGVGAVGPFDLACKTQNGLLVVPGTGGVVSVSYE